MVVKVDVTQMYWCPILNDAVSLRVVVIAEGRFEYHPIKEIILKNAYIHLLTFVGP